ncbi:hypothetical protein [Natrinema versiforme]|uniref:Uncharacterized protein n=1 Tax=Natrinema versiforme JCM 10478 TaxID=1227496 RepID=L9XT20_9EURY|nr:hypothetical protein [Natrinema versiforme]ELY64949.1 hypothetical protein C489_16081 [Natrinema versiforme JCM 10478]
MSGSGRQQSESATEGQLSPGLIGVAVGALDVPVFAYVGLELFGDPVFGAFVGLVVGLGMYLSMPAFMADDDDDEHSDPPLTSVEAGRRLRQFHRTAAGLALPPAGMLLLTWRLVSENLRFGVLATLVITAAIYAPLAVLLPRRYA